MFFIEYLFVPNLESFSKAKMKTNFDEFNDCVNDVIKNFESLTGIKLFDLMEKLK